MIPRSSPGWRWRARLTTAISLWLALALPAGAQQPGAQQPDAQPAGAQTAGDACRAVAGTLSAGPTGTSGAAVCRLRSRAAHAPSFSLQLPVEAWNGGLAEVRCGRLCPATDHVICRSVTARGYACLAGGGTHQALQAASALTARYFRRPVQTTLLLGASLGGGEALRQVASDPTDFAAILVIAPILDERETDARLLWTLRALRGTAAHPGLGRDELALLHAGAVAACDADDGLVDGLIGDPLRCRFDPAALRCGEDRGKACLNADQVESARRIYHGPLSSSGRESPQRGQLPGSEPGWERLLGAPGRALEAQLRQRIRTARPSGAPPDLHAFAAAGGKALLLQGLADPIQSPRAVVEYYEASIAALGGRMNVARSLRLFVVPGMRHCTGGEGPWRIDPLRALEAWVARGAVRPPDDLIGFHPLSDSSPAGSFFTPEAQDPAEAAYSSWLLGSGVTLAQARDAPHAAFSRPLYLYPMRTRYKGAGDPRSWLSFYSPNDYGLLDE